MSESQSEYDDDEIFYERILSQSEILSTLREYIDQFDLHTLGRELSDEQGIYLLEINIADPETGKISEYAYHRKGAFGKHIHSQTDISVTYYDADGMLNGGKDIANYDETTGDWKKACDAWVYNEQTKKWELPQK
jgi:hypothetical protein